VTNPPIDAIREEIIMGEDMMLGPESNLLEEGPQHCIVYGSSIRC